jgi:FlaA1/EpsC-like NDP-sugar epimerase
VITPGQQVVFHTATAAPSAANSLNEELMYAVNVKGTEHVIAACKANGVTKLVSLLIPRFLAGPPNLFGARAASLCEYQELLCDLLFMM